MMRRLLVIGCVAIAAGCGGATRTVSTVPSTQSAFATVLAHAADDANTGHFAVADKELQDFAVGHPASGEAVETLYWRAIYLLDPGNTAGSLRDAAALLDAYVTSPAASRRAEATTLRRMASALEAARTSAASASAPQKAAETPAPDKGKDEEIVRLKDDLAKANAELDRIRRRLAKP